MPVNASTATTATLGELTAEQVRSVLIEPLALSSVFLSAGPTIYDTAGPLRIPRAPAFDAADLTFVGEGEEIPEADADAAELRLLPSTMKSIKTITRFTGELTRQGVVNVEAALRSSLVRTVAAKIDAQLLGDAGDGVTTPRGMFAYADVENVDPAEHDGSVPDALIEAQGLALAAGVQVDRLALFLRPDALTALRTLKAGDTDARYLLGTAESGAVSTILGMRYYVSTAIPVGRMAVADMSQIAVARDLAPTVKLLDQTYAGTDELGLRVITRYDAAPIHTSAIVTVGTAPDAGDGGGEG